MEMEKTMTAGPILRANIHRMRALPNAGGRTILFRLDVGRRPKFLQPSAVPEFEGDDAVIEYHYRAGRLVLGRIVPPEEMPSPDRRIPVVGGIREEQGFFEDHAAGRVVG